MKSFPFSRPDPAHFLAIRQYHTSIPFDTFLRLGRIRASYTISAWAKPTDAGRNPILGDFWIPPAFLLLAEVGGLPTYRHRMAVAPASDTFTVSSAAWTVNQWNHLAVAWDPTGQVARFYVDGAYVARKVVRQPAANLPMVDNNQPPFPRPPVRP
jgi:hypothetical protein